VTSKVDPYYVQPEDTLEDMQPNLERALGLTRADLEKMSLEARNLFSARRKLGHTWLDDYEVVVECTEVGPQCGCGIQKGQQLVFDMRHKVLPAESTAPLCVHLMAPVLPIFYMTFDRAAEGLNPFTCVWRYQECPITGPDDGAHQTRTRAFLRDRKTKEVVYQRHLSKPEGAN
jgi:hypothetical protein